jgi:hypothetical protein
MSVESGRKKKKRSDTGNPIQSSAGASKRKKPRSDARRLFYGDVNRRRPRDVDRKKQPNCDAKATTTPRFVVVLQSLRSTNDENVKRWNAAESEKKPRLPSASAKLTLSKSGAD